MTGTGTGRAGQLCDNDGSRRDILLTPLMTDHYVPADFSARPGLSKTGLNDRSTLSSSNLYVPHNIRGVPC